MIDCREPLCYRAICVTHVSRVIPKSRFKLWKSREFVFKIYTFSGAPCRPTFRRIIRSKSTEQFSGLPYIYGLLNCLICLWYGMPIVSPGIIHIATVNSVGAIFQSVYLIIYIIHAEKAKKVINPFQTQLSFVSAAKYSMQSTYT